MWYTTADEFGIRDGGFSIFRGFTRAKTKNSNESKKN